MLRTSRPRSEFADIASLEPRAEASQDLVADRVRSGRDLVEGHGAADQVDVVAGPDRVRRHRGDVDARQVHRYAADDGHSHALERRVTTVADRTRVPVCVSDRAYREPARR